MDKIEKCLRKHLNDECITFSSNISGGIVNRAALFQSGNRKYFVKYNSDEKTKQLFESEKASLQLMEEIGITRVPKSIQVLDHPDGIGGIHVLEYIEGLKPMENCWSELAAQVARLHKHNADLLTTKGNTSGGNCVNTADTGVSKFGFHIPPFMGLFTPGAVWRETWQQYFVEDILEPIVNLLVDKYQVKAVTEYWNIVKPKLPRVFADVDIQPTLLHGDFCTANIGETPDGPVIFDHSCMYGHSEFEFVIAVNEGGFPEEFFRKYHEIIPRVPGHEKREVVYRLFYTVIMWFHVDTEEWKERTLQSFKALLDVLN